MHKFVFIFLGLVFFLTSCTQPEKCCTDKKQCDSTAVDSMKLDSVSMDTLKVDTVK